MDHQELPIMYVTCEELMKISKEMNTVGIWKGENAMYPCWYVLAKELIKEEDLTSIEEKLIPVKENAALIWLNEIVRKRPEVQVDGLKQIAQNLKRNDIYYMLEQITKERRFAPMKLMHLTTNEKYMVAEKLREEEGGLSEDWRDFADVMGYKNTEIEIIRESANPSMHVLKYIRRYYPFTTLQKIEEICQTKMMCKKLAETVNNILQLNLYNRQVKYNGSPIPAKQKRSWKWKKNTE